MILSAVNVDSYHRGRLRKLAEQQNQTTCTEPDPGQTYPNQEVGGREDRSQQTSWMPETQGCTQPSFGIGFIGLLLLNYFEQRAQANRNRALHRWQDLLLEGSILPLCKERELNLSIPVMIASCFCVCACKHQTPFSESTCFEKLVFYTPRTLKESTRRWGNWALPFYNESVKHHPMF